MHQEIDNQVFTEDMLFTELTPQEAMTLNGGIFKKMWRKFKRGGWKSAIVGAAISAAAVATGGAIAVGGKKGVALGGKWLF